MNANILLIEDSPHKKAKIIDHLRSINSLMKIFEAASFASGCQAIDNKIYDLVLMDMSLPTYDRSGSQSSGRFRTFGGREIARKIIKRSEPTKIVFITQYEAFSDKGRSYSYESLKKELQDECGAFFGGMIFFDSAKTSWKDDLTNIINKL